MRDNQNDDDDGRGLLVERFWAVVHPHRRSWKTRYRKDAPKNRALVVINFGIPQDLCHIGEDFEWLLDENGDKLTEYLPEKCDLPNGVYIWEGVVTSRCWEDYCGGGVECDDDVDGEFRPVTEEEWSAWVGGEYPWDPMLWYLSDVEEDDEKPEQPEESTIDVSFSGLLHELPMD